MGFYDENSTQFKEELEASEKWRQKVGRMLLKAGLRVEVPPLEYRESLADRSRFKQDRDVIVWIGAVEHAIVEVKSRNEEFDSAEDFGRRLYRKYKEREIFVDTKYGWDSKDPKPRYVFMVSRPTGKVICLPGRTQEKWSVGERHDNTRNITDKFYMAHPDLFIPVKKAIGWMMKKQASLEPSRYEVGKLTLQLKHSNKILDRIQNAVLNEESNEKMIEDALCDRWPE